MRIARPLILAAAAPAIASFVSFAALAREPAVSEPPAGSVGGTTVQVGPDGGVSVGVQADGQRLQRMRERRQQRLEERAAAGQGSPVPVGRFWIGLGGGPLPPELRAQIDIPADEGVLIRSVAADSPAAGAGVQVFDILVRANGAAIDDLRRLADLVGEAGEAGESIELEVLRRGQRIQVEVTPVERAIDSEVPTPEFGGRRPGLFGPEGLLGPNGMLGGEGLQGLLGPGGAPLGGEGLGGLAELMPQVAGAGVSVRVERQNGAPAKVIVTRGDQTWEFAEGDAAAMAALPDDLRPMVEGMLRQSGLTPGEDFEGFGFGGPGFQMQFGGEELAGRMRAMQQRMLQMQRGLAAPPAGPTERVAPEIELDEAPAFGSDDPAGEELEPEIDGKDGAAPLEIEVPGE